MNVNYLSGLVFQLSKLVSRPRDTQFSFSMNWSVTRIQSRIWDTIFLMSVGIWDILKKHKQKNFAGFQTFKTSLAVWKYYNISSLQLRTELHQSIATFLMKQVGFLGAAKLCIKCWLNVDSGSIFSPFLHFTDLFILINLLP